MYSTTTAPRGAGSCGTSSHPLTGSPANPENVTSNTSAYLIAVLTGVNSGARAAARAASSCPDGSWIFHFVNVIDDIEMKISHVIRGEDHLSNTPKHIEIYRALGAKPPHFAHIPLILNRNGSKMSKRDEGARVSTYIEQGYVPEAVRNYLCLLGWSPKDNREKIDIDEVIKLFELEKINRRNAAFDLNKCFRLNGQYTLQMSLDRFIELAKPFLEKAKIDIADEAYLRAVLSIVKEKIKLLSDVPEWTSYFFSENYEFDSAAVEKVFGKAEATPRLIALHDVFDKIDY